MKKISNEFEPFLNECQTYVWEWYIPEHKVRFGIPSLNRLWIDDKEKNIQLATMLERVHPDDIQKVLVRKTSPLFRSDKMFEVDLRLNVADELMPDGAQASGKYEWYGFRGKTIRRDAKGQPTYVRGVAINLDQRYRAQMKLIAQKEHQLQSMRQQNSYSISVMQEVYAFMRGLAENANSLVKFDAEDTEQVVKLNELQLKAERIMSLTDKFRSYMGENGQTDQQEIKPLSLWEHLAELQQVYSLKASSLKISFSNLYDRCMIYVNVKLLDLLIANIINLEQRSKSEGRIDIRYSVHADSNQLIMTFSLTGSQLESGFGINVCRILAKRLWGDVAMSRHDADKLEYVVMIPIDPRNTLHAIASVPEQDTLDELDDEIEQEQSSRAKELVTLPMVLFGLIENDDHFEDQHLFDATICNTTDRVCDAFDNVDPVMVFIDNRLRGEMTVNDLIARIHAQHPDTPIIISADEATRPLHKQLRQMGATYLLNNPITPRKVNMMIKRYLK